MVLDDLDMETIRNPEALDKLLSRPSRATIDSLLHIDGDVIVLGAGGKMGPSLTRMARRAFDSSGKTNRVMAVSRFSDAGVRENLKSSGIETIACDLLDRDAVSKLPDAANVVFMAGQKFGTTGNPAKTWAMNTVVPEIVAERFRNSRIVAFSTGCVYPDVRVDSGGSVEIDPLEPLGEYANSCVGRERIFEYFATRHRTPLALLRLNYAIALRYGVLTDIGLKVWNGEPIDLSTGYANVIWEGDACNVALQCLEKSTVPPLILNVTGTEVISIRDMAQRFADLLGRNAILTGRERDMSLLSNSGRMAEIFGPPDTTLEQMIDWTACWIKNGLPLLDKPTHYDVRDGRY